VIEPSALAAIRRHAAEVYPEECCGALIGADGRVREALALPNETADGARRRFLVRPGDYRSAERRAEEVGSSLLGFYHSHPDHPARPSAHDLAHAWPSFSYVIVSVRRGRPLDVTSWRLRADRSSFDAEPLAATVGEAEGVAPKYD
jgi:proteasome lid subunit RPN8/RPN11